MEIECMWLLTYFIMVRFALSVKFCHFTVRSSFREFLDQLTQFIILTECTVLIIEEYEKSNFNNLYKGRPTLWHLLYYVNLLLNMFRMLIHPSSGAGGYLVRYCVGCNVLTWGVLVLCRLQPALGYHITNSQSRYITPITLHNYNNAPSSRKLLKMDVLTSETCWAVN